MSVNPASGDDKSGMALVDADALVGGGDRSITGTDDPAHSAVQKAAKRGMDIVLTLVFLIVALPLMAVIAALLAREGGPAIFSHQRVGRGGKLFRCLKFRSMVVGADEILRRHLDACPEAAEEWRRTQKLRDDPRVTAVGRFLRRTSLDELPQLFNVLKGDMSLVGPRPVTVEELDRYGPHVRRYLSLRPGLTGLWQVSGRSNLSYDERVRLDSEYALTWTLPGDLKIIAITPFVVVFRIGAI